MYWKATMTFNATFLWCQTHAMSCIYTYTWNVILVATFTVVLESCHVLCMYICLKCHRLPYYLPQYQNRAMCRECMQVIYTWKICFVATLIIFKIACAVCLHILQHLQWHQSCRAYNYMKYWTHQNPCSNKVHVLHIQLKFTIQLQDCRKRKNSVQKF